MTERERALSEQYDRVFAYVRRRTRSCEDAEDITQTVFQDALRSLAATDAKLGSDLAWLYVIARRRLIDHWRQADFSESPLPQISADQQMPDYGPRIAHALAYGIGRLPREQKAVVVMKLLEGKRFAEIAATLGKTEEACRACMARGMRTLRDHLEQEGMKP